MANNLYNLITNDFEYSKDFLPEMKGSSYLPNLPPAMPIPGHEMYVIDKDGNVYNKKNKRIAKDRTLVKLCCDGRVTIHSVNKLLALTWYKKDTFDVNVEQKEHMLDDELKEIPGYPGYAITQDGRVYSYSKKIEFKTFVRNPALFKHTGTWLSTRPTDTKAYILYKDGKSKRIPILTLLLLTWCKKDA